MSSEASLRFAVYGRPRPKSRPRIVRIGHSSHAYTPRETTAYESRVRDVAAREVSARDAWDMEARVWMRIVAYMPGRHRVDLDNVAKAITDACNGVLYDDDSQIDELYVRREIDREHPRVEVEVGHMVHGR